MARSALSSSAATGILAFARGNIVALCDLKACAVKLLKSPPSGDALTLSNCHLAVPPQALHPSLPSFIPPVPPPPSRCAPGCVCVCVCVCVRARTVLGGGVDISIFRHNSFFQGKIDRGSFVPMQSHLNKPVLSSKEDGRFYRSSSAICTACTLFMCKFSGSRSSFMLLGSVRCGSDVDSTGTTLVDLDRYLHK